jgi:hypothetical protein
VDERRFSLELRGDEYPPLCLLDEKYPSFELVDKRHSLHGVDERGDSVNVAKLDEGDEDVDVVRLEEKDKGVE